MEYGGTNETENSPIYNVDYMKKIYLESGYDKIINNSDLDKSDLYFFTFPDNEILRDFN